MNKHDKIFDDNYRNKKTFKILTRPKSYKINTKNPN
jgi:hypothetical protein